MIEGPRPSGARILRRLAWIAGYAAVRGGATTAGGAAVTAVVWWIHSRCPGASDGDGVLAGRRN